MADMGQDGVDMILEQWEEVRPDLDCSPMAVIGRLSRLSRLMEAELRPTFVENGLEPGEFDVLATLLRSGPPHVLSAGALSTASMVSSAALTNRIDRLVDKGLVGRGVDPTHRRRVLISLSAEGRDLVNRVAEVHVANERRLLTGLSNKDCLALSALLRRLLISLGDGQALDTDRTEPS